METLYINYTGTTSNKPNTKYLNCKVGKSHLETDETESLKEHEKTAKGLEISKYSMHRVFKDVLRLTAYKRQSKQLILKASKKKRLDRDKFLFDKIKRATDTVFIWSDRKIFTVEAVLNKQNNRI